MSAPLVTDILLLRPILHTGLFLLVVWSVPRQADAQLIDSIGLFLEQPHRYIVKLDVRGGFISNSAARFFGIKVGRDHARRVQYGIGYSFLTTPVLGNRLVTAEGNQQLVTTKLRLNYFTPYFEYAFYRRKRVEVRIPVQVGIGWGNLRYERLDGKNERIERSMIFLYEPAMTVHYHFSKYAAIGGGVGFRLVARTRSDLGETLTAPIYLFGLKIFFGDIWRDLKGSADTGVD